MMLPVHPKPHIDESLSGYLIRLALANKYAPSFIYQTFVQFAGKSNYNYFLDTTSLCDEDLQHISLLSNCAIDELEKHMFLKVKGSNLYQYKKGVVNIKTINRIKIRVCPLCLKKSSYIKSVWVLLNGTVCPYHNVQLIDNCDKCGKSISWLNPNFINCKCGHLYNNSKLIEANDDSLLITSLLYSKLGILPTPLLNIDPIFTKMDLNTYNNIILFVTQFLINYKEDSHYSHLKKSVTDYINVQSKITLILKNWPTGYYEFLRDLKSKHMHMDFYLELGDISESLKLLRNVYYNSYS